MGQASPLAVPSCDHEIGTGRRPRSSTQTCHNRKVSCPPERRRPGRLLSVNGRCIRARVLRMKPNVALTRALALFVASGLALSMISTSASPAGASSSTATTSLPPLHALRPSMVLRSPNGRYSAELLRDGALVVLGPKARVIWSNGVGNAKGSPRLVLERSGDLVEFANSGGPTVWRSGSKSVPRGLRLVVRNNGELVVESSLSPAWTSTAGDISQTLTIVGFGDSEGAETDQFLGGALRDSGNATTAFTAHDFPGTAVCDWIDNGTMATAVNADVVALFFSGDGFTPCTDPSAHLSAMALSNLTVADVGVAVNMLLAGTVQHVLVISPVPGAPSTTISSDYLATRLQAMVKSFHSSRVVYVDAPSLSVSPRGAAPRQCPAPTWRSLVASVEDQL